MHRAAQHAAHHLLNHAVVAVAAVKIAAEFVRFEQRAHKVAGADLAGAQLRFEHRITVDLEGVEEDLAVGLFDQFIGAGAVEAQGKAAALTGGLFAALQKVADAGVVGQRFGGQ